ncbi:GGDEF domain-containing protein [Halomonas sp.]|uniref:GGDEF domain-containing protein n=1 Tax=Halomonas sp. TaxID=1486246 RepID=UPI00298EB857|nr:GGDEF domain-containing protein [Halomonas sp.]MDW7748272.1 GGDEF domain-containing protein [Halomonas sp.]
MLEVADRMTDTLCQYDKVIRKGGEEFLIILPNTVLGAAVSTVERLRVVVSATPMPGPRIIQTLSSGVAQLNPDESAAVLLDRTDRILYQAKGDGRNRVESINEAPLLTSIPRE